MRNFINIPILCLSLFALSCSPEEQTEREGNQEKAELKTLSFKIDGDLVTEEPIGKTREIGEDDLFALQLFDAESEKPYAHVLGDDLSQVSVDFKTGHTYTLKMTYVRNAKDSIYRYENRWGSPFSVSYQHSAELNKTYYSSELKMESISSPGINSRYEDGGRYTKFDRYHGVIQDFEVGENQEDLVISLKRLVFGLRLNMKLPAKDQETIYFSINGEGQELRKFLFSVEEGTGTLEIPHLTLGIPSLDYFEDYLNQLDKAVFGAYGEEVQISIGTPEHHTFYFDGTITVKRNMMMVIDFTAGEPGETSNGSININYEGEMKQDYIELSAR